MNNNSHAIVQVFDWICEKDGDEKKCRRLRNLK